MASRCASVEALSETASLGRMGSSASSRILGTMPAVEMVMRRSGTPIRSVGDNVHCLHHRRKVEQRLAHAMKTSSSACGEASPARGDRQNLAHDLARRETSLDPSSAVKQNLQSTAQPTWLESRGWSAFPPACRPFRWSLSLPGAGDNGQRGLLRETIHRYGIRNMVVPASSDRKARFRLVILWRSVARRL